MADRTVIVRLLAEVGQFRAAMASAGQATRQLDTQVANINRSVQRSTKSMGTAFAGMRGMILGFGVPLGIAAMGKAFLDFERQMAHVRAVAPDAFGRSAVGMAALRKMALEAGTAYGFTATEVGKAQEELAKAGRSTAQILGGELNSALVLAAAGTISLDESAKLLAVTLTQFEGEGLTAARAADMFAKSANATVSNVSEMGTALSYVGPMAAAMGMSFEDTIVTLSLFNQAGIQADMAGTSLRGTLTALTSPSKMARDEMKRLGIELYDADGKFIGIGNAAEELKNELGKLPEAQRNVSIGMLATNAMLPGFITLYKSGKQGIEDMRTAVLASAGAQEVAKEKLNSLTGDLSKFGAAMTNSVIKTLATASPLLRGLTEGLTGAANAWGSMGGAAQLATLAMIGQLFMARRVRTAVGEMGGGFGKAAASWRELETAMRVAGATGQAFGPGSHLRPGHNRLDYGPDGSYGWSRAPIGKDPGPTLGPAQPSGRDLAQMREQALEARGLGAELARLGHEWRTAGSAAGKFGAVAGASLRGVRGAISGLSGALGGPWGVAIMAAAGAFAYFSGKAAQSKERVQDLTAGMLSLSTLWATTGQLSMADTKGLYEANTQIRDMVNHSERYKTNVVDIVKAGTGSKDAYNAVLKDMDNYLGRLAGTEKAFGTPGDYIDIKKQHDLMKALDITPAKDVPFYKDEGSVNVGKIRDRIKLTNEERDAFKRLHGDQIKVTEALERTKNLGIADELKKRKIAVDGATEAERQLASATVTLGSADATVSARLEATANGLKLMTGMYLDATDAAAGFWGARMEVGSAFEKEGKGGKEKVKPKLDWVTGGFDQSAEGLAQHDKFAKMARASTESYLQTYNKVVMKTGDANAAGMAAVQVQMEQRDAALRTASAMGMTDAEALTLVNTMFQIPRDVAIQFNVPGMDEAIAKANELGVKVTTMPDGKVVLYAESEKALRDVGAVNIKKIGDKKFKAILTNPEEVGGVLKQLGQEKTVKVNVKTESSANAAEQGLKTTQQTTLAKITAQVDQSSVGAAEATLKVLTEARETLIKAKADAASINATEQEIIAATNGIMVSIPFTWRNVGGVPTPPGGQASGGGGGPGPGGGGDPYRGKPRDPRAGAHGLFQAHTAPPGTLYQWAEPETGGEAFVPRLGNRSRSVGILKQAASWHGHKVTPMAAGGITASGINAPLSDFFQKWMSPDLTRGEQQEESTLKHRAALRSVHSAEAELKKVQKDRKATVDQLREAEDNLTRSRRELANSSRELSRVRMRPMDQLGASLGGGIKNRATFFWWLQKLADRGFGDLAMQLLAMGGPEAERMAQDAAKMTDSALRTVAHRSRTAQDQEKYAQNLPAILAVRGALKGGQGYDQLVGSGKVTAEELNSALALMTAELQKTPQGRAMLAAMHGANAKALEGRIRGYATGGIASPGEHYRYAEPSTGGEALIPRFGSNAVPTLKAAAAWHGMDVVKSQPWDYRSRPAGGSHVQITVHGEGVLSQMIDARVDGALVTVSRVVTRGAAKVA